MASEHPLMERARRGPKGKVDTFLAFWLGILADGRQSRFEASRTRTRRSIEKFFADPAVVEAGRVLGEDAVAAELRDAAALYFRTCLTDVAYTSTLFRTKRMDEAQIIGKAAGEAAAAVGVLRESAAQGELPGKLPLLLLQGWLAEIGQEHAASLQAALRANKASAPVADLLD